MSWNHRVRRRVLRNRAGTRETFYDIVEVLYDKKDRPWGSTEESMAPVGNTMDELRECLTMMLRATWAPIYDEKKDRVGTPPGRGRVTRWKGRK